jgi:hypothetical protein
MIDSAADVARRLRRDARRGEAVRHWAGWRLALTFGPYETAFDPARAAAAKRAAAAIMEEAAGAPVVVTAEMEAASLESQRDLWHLSASWRGNHPVEEGRRLLAELVAALGVPAEGREGEQVARVYGADGRTSPQVTHWVWRDAPA